ncbi:MAG: hypothetical protein AB7V13_08695 [Pseudorhodoplanes sp.]
MFWIALLFGASALFFTQYGAMSVTVKLLSYALAAIVLMASMLGLVFLIRKFWPIWRGWRWRLSWRQ